MQKQVFRLSNFLKTKTDKSDTENLQVEYFNPVFQALNISFVF